MWGVGISGGVEIGGGQSRAEEERRRREVASWFESSPQSSPGTSPSKQQGYLSWAWDTLTGNGKSLGPKYMDSVDAYSEHMRKEALKKPKV